MSGKGGGEEERTSRDRTASEPHATDVLHRLGDWVKSFAGGGDSSESRQGEGNSGGGGGGTSFPFRSHVLDTLFGAHPPRNPSGPRRDALRDRRASDDAPASPRMPIARNESNQSPRVRGSAPRSAPSSPTPQPVFPPPVRRPTMTYTITPGDSATHIAVMHDMTVGELCSLNHMHADEMDTGREVLVFAPQPHEASPPAAGMAQSSTTRTTSTTSTSSSSAADGGDGAVPSPVWTVLKVRVQYMHPRSDVMGTLTITPTWMVFEPDLGDVATVEHGTFALQFTADVSDVVDVILEESPDPGAMPSSPSLQPANQDAQLALHSADIIVIDPAKGHVAHRFLGPKGDLEDVCKVIFRNAMTSEQVPSWRPARVRMPIARRHAQPPSKGGKPNTPKSKAAASTPPQPRGRAGNRHDPSTTASTTTPRRVVGATYAPLMESHVTAVPHLSSTSTSSGRKGRSKGGGRSTSPVDGPPRRPARPATPPRPHFIGREPLSITHRHAELLLPHLPRRMAERDWVVEYSSEGDGVSLQTFFRKVAGHDPTLIFVQTVAGDVIGAFTSGEWRVRSKYFGTGETFLFSFASSDGSNAGSDGAKNGSSSNGSDGPTSDATANNSGGSATNEPREPRVYRWSGGNAYFLLAYEDSIAVGGGGRPGLWLDGGFERGTSGHCSTFDSDPLARTEDFEVLRVEAITFKGL